MTRATTQTPTQHSATVLVGHGVTGNPTRLRRLYAAAVKWLEQLGHPPSLAVVQAPGFSGRPIQFGRAEERLRALGFPGVTSFHLLAMLPNWEDLAGDWYAKVSWNARDETAVFASLSTLIPFGGGQFDAAADILVRSGRPRYGFAYQMGSPLAAVLYVTGTGLHRIGEEILAGEAYEQARRVAGWGIRGIPRRVWRKGTLRDVYEWNYLTARALGRKVGDIPLAEWIAGNTERGELVKHGEGAVWRISANQLSEVRSQLDEAGLLFR